MLLCIRLPSAEGESLVISNQTGAPDALWAQFVLMQIFGGENVNKLDALCMCLKDIGALLSDESCACDLRK